MANLYLVNPVIQKKEIDELCFGRCKKILMGAIDLGEMGGAWFPCKHACPYEERREPLDEKYEGDDLILRKLKEASDV